MAAPIRVRTVPPRHPPGRHDINRAGRMHPEKGPIVSRWINGPRPAGRRKTG
jgi:hypothetical protein